MGGCAGSSPKREALFGRRISSAAVAYYAASFDGTNWLKNSTANYRSADSSGSICLWFRTSSATEQTFFASHDEGSLIDFVWLFINSGAVGIYSNAGGTDYGVSTDATTFADGAWHFLEARSSGTAYLIRIDGSEQTLYNADGDHGAGTNNGHWFADVSNRDNITAGAAIFSATDYYLDGEVGTPLVFSVPLTDAESDWLYNSGTGRNYVHIETSGDADNPGVNNLDGGAWDTDETSGNRADSSGNGLTLVPGGVSSVTRVQRL